MKKQSQSVALNYLVCKSRRTTNVKKRGRISSVKTLIAVGNEEGGYNIAKGAGKESSVAQKKALAKAQKTLKHVNVGRTIPHEVRASKGATSIILRPAVAGTGIVAGGALRKILILVGVKDVVGKIIGSSNQYNVIYCTVKALNKLNSLRQIANIRGCKTKDLLQYYSVKDYRFVSDKEKEKSENE